MTSITSWRNWPGEACVCTPANRGRDVWCTYSCGLSTWVCCPARVMRQRPLELASWSAQYPKPAAPSGGVDQTSKLHLSGSFPASLFHPAPWKQAKEEGWCNFSKGIVLQILSTCCQHRTIPVSWLQKGALWALLWPAMELPGPIHTHRVTFSLPKWYMYLCQSFRNVTFYDRRSFMFIVRNFDNVSI